ncbi:hypothetical protein [Rhizobium phaseoli]|uniref:hypothetical protein n=1 Tax=Rhizobium phaseoli TaxID=396 RepID=UPI000BE97602|nr:hypothetical protein [Rhizobium phaseoli]PDS69638.1 hypothetical protein CO651_22985 [Rhizobium phaseoli]
MHVLRLVFTLVLLLPIATACMADGLQLSYLVDSDGKRVGAALTRDGKAVAGEIFVDSNGTVGFIDCDRKLISVDLTNVAKTSANCVLAPAKWSRSIYSQLLQKRPLELPDGRTVELDRPLNIFGEPKICAGSDCGQPAFSNCALCEPVDPTDPTWCAGNPACQTLPDSALWVPGDRFKILKGQDSVYQLPQELRGIDLIFTDRNGRAIDLDANDVVMSPMKALPDFDSLQFNPNDAVKTDSGPDNTSNPEIFAPKPSTDGGSFDGGGFDGGTGGGFDGGTGGGFQ